jgi:hypothetical protein
VKGPLAGPFASSPSATEGQFVGEGTGEYGRCVVFHGFDAISPAMAPDLRASTTLAATDAFADIIRYGSRMEDGMPVFS